VKRGRPTRAAHIAVVLMLAKIKEKMKGGERKMEER